MGSRGGEDSCCHGGTQTGGVWDERGRQSDHWQTVWSHILADKPRGPDSEWRRTGQAERLVAPHRPTFTIEKPGGTAGSEADRATQGSTSGK